MDISIIMPGRNNLKYAKWSYDSIQKNKGRHNVQICFADDNSDDGTWEWCEELMVKDSNFKAIRNNSGERVGHTILYDRLVNEVADYEMCIIWHCDMYLCPGALDAIEREMYTAVHTDHVEGGFEMVPNDKTITSLTRIEPPLHPPGPEKILRNFGTEPEEFPEEQFLDWFSDHIEQYKTLSGHNTTEGVFAPWAFWKEEFQEIGGHDPLFAPQSKEDSDIFNRFKLNGTVFKQTWLGYVYHMTCRGSRFNPTLTSVGTNSPEWNAQNLRSTINFVRKWGQPVQHDSYMNPIIPVKYDIGVVLSNASLELIKAIEPWVSTLYVSYEGQVDIVEEYVKEEQQNTKYDLKERVRYDNSNRKNDILIYIDGSSFTQNDYVAIQQLPTYISNMEKFSKYRVGSMTIQTGKLTQHQNQLIKVKPDYVKT